MTCHMVEVENNLGRSLVRDLKTDSANKFRQIDHRSIESIIFKNVKYVLKRSGGKNFGDVDTHIPKDEAKWDSSKLAIGNVFSGTSYYETVSEMGNNEVFVYEKNQNNRGVVIDKSILCDEMHNASVWDNEEKVSKTQLASILVDANDVCFQVCFDTQASEKKALATLSELKRVPKDENKLREIIQSCLTGNEQTMICRLSKAEGKLGRSLVVELPTQGYRQVDHRSIKWIAIGNTKYVLKK